MKRISSLTYPRSGSHFFQYCIKYATGLDVNRVHETKYLLDEDLVVCIVRDPEECIPSIAAMNKKTYDDHGYNESEEASLFNNLQNAVDDFIDFYTTAVNSAGTLIKFEDLINNTNGVVSHIANIIGVKNKTIPTNMVEKYDEYAKINLTKSILRTSTTLENYNYAKNLLNEFDVDNLKSIYNEILKSCDRI